MEVKSLKKLFMKGIVVFLLGIISFTQINYVSALSLSQRLDALEKKKKMPIGTIVYMTNDINPGTIFGGTWEETAKGKAIVGVDENDEDFQTAKLTGGEKEVTLTASQMPTHKHSATTNSAGSHSHTVGLVPNSMIGGPNAEWNGGYYPFSSFGFLPPGLAGKYGVSTSGGYFYNRLIVSQPNLGISTSYNSFSHTHSYTTNSQGGSTAHNNLQPYYVVRIWEKIAD